MEGVLMRNLSPKNADRKFLPLSCFCKTFWTLEYCFEFIVCTKLPEGWIANIQLCLRADFLSPLLFCGGTSFPLCIWFNSSMMLCVWGRGGEHMPQPPWAIRPCLRDNIRFTQWAMFIVKLLDIPRLFSFAQNIEYRVNVFSLSTHSCKLHNL